MTPLVSFLCLSFGMHVCLLVVALFAVWFGDVTHEWRMATEGVEHGHVERGAVFGRPHRRRERADRLRGQARVRLR